MISNVLSNAIASIRHQAVDGDILPSTLAAQAAPKSAVHEWFAPAFDGEVDLPSQGSHNSFDRLAQHSRVTLQGPTWLRENLSPMEVTVKQLLREIKSVQEREDRATNGVKQREEQGQGVSNAMKRAADALADVRSAGLSA